jgi:hypothetical protein
MGFSLTFAFRYGVQLEIIAVLFFSCFSFLQCNFSLNVNVIVTLSRIIIATKIIAKKTSKLLVICCNLIVHLRICNFNQISTKPEVINFKSSFMKYFNENFRISGNFLGFHTILINDDG